MEKVYSHTIALCPECKEKVNTRIIERENKIYLEKFCGKDGISMALICGDKLWYENSRDYIKPIQSPLDYSVEKFSGCGESCGICPAHLQHSCMPIIEITNKCNLECPVCLKKVESDYEINPAEFQNILNTLVKCEGDIPVINLSGGEPTVHSEFESILDSISKSNIIQATVSTNGLRLLRDKALRKVFKEKGVIAALQFDGFQSDTYIKLRGRDLLKEKFELIKIFEDEEIKYSLVCVIMKNQNDNEIKEITEFFFENNALSLMFQPAAFTGRAGNIKPAEIITIPEIVREIEKSKFTNKGDFNPLPCSHYSCFALSYYLQMSDKKYISMKEFLGKENYLNVIANKSLPGLDKDSYSLMKEKIYELWSASDSSQSNEALLKRIRLILEKLNKTGFQPKEAFNIGSESIKAIFIHQFMDINSFDFGRAIKCCNHYPQADGRIMPVCASNVLG